MAEKRYMLGEKAASDFKRIVRKVDGMRGPGVVNRPDSISINPPGRGRGPNRIGEDGTPESFIARLGTPTSLGGNQWTYPFTEVVKTAAGYGGWTDLADGRTGTARNLIEDQNAATGTQGNGVSVSDLVGTFALQPCPAGTRVRVWPVVFQVNGDTTVEYWFEYSNGITGACP